MKLACASVAFLLGACATERPPLRARGILFAEPTSEGELAESDALILVGEVAGPARVASLTRVAADVVEGRFLLRNGPNGADGVLAFFERSAAGWELIDADFQIEGVFVEDGVSFVDAATLIRWAREKEDAAIHRLYRIQRGPDARTFLVSFDYDIPLRPERKPNVIVCETLPRANQPVTIVRGEVVELRDRAIVGTQRE